MFIVNLLHQFTIIVGEQFFFDIEAFNKNIVVSKQQQLVNNDIKKGGLYSQQPCFRLLH